MIHARITVLALPHQLCFVAGRLCTSTPCKLLVKAKVFYNTDNVGMRVLNFGINAHVCHLRVILLTVTLEFVIRGGTEDIRAFLATELVS